MTGRPSRRGFNESCALFKKHSERGGHLRGPGRRGHTAQVGGQPLEDVRTYRMATNDFLAAGGDAYTTFKAGANLVYGELVRDVFSAYLERKSPVRPQIENRIEIAKP